MLINNLLVNSLTEMVKLKGIELGFTGIPKDPSGFFCGDFHELSKDLRGFLGILMKCFRIFRDHQGFFTILKDP